MHVIIHMVESITFYIVQFTYSQRLRCARLHSGGKPDADVDILSTLFLYRAVQRSCCARLHSGAKPDTDDGMLIISPTTIHLSSYDALSPYG